MKKSVKIRKRKRRLTWEEAAGDGPLMATTPGTEEDRKFMSDWALKRRAEVEAEAQKKDRSSKK